MKAFVLTDDGARIREVAAPRPGPAEVLVAVRACALNRADLGMARGRLHGRAGGAGSVLGMEWAGEVAEVGADVSAYRPGDRVMGSGAGAFAEQAVADVGRVLPIPAAGMTFEEAACLPVALQTMHDAIVTNGQMVPGQSVLVHGASSGVGLMAMQIAKVRGAALVVGSSTNAERRSRLASFGADLAVDPNRQGWVEEVLAATEGGGVDLVIDQVSGAGFNETMKATRIKGRIVNVGRLGGERGEFDFDLHALRRINYVGVTFRTRSKQEVREITERMLADLAAPLAEGKLGLPVDATFPLDELPQALERMRANEHFGKIVVSV